MMKKVILLMMTLCMAMAVAQEKSGEDTPKPPQSNIPVLTMQEKLDLRNAQIEEMRAQMALDQAVQQLPQFDAKQRADKKVQLLLNLTFRAHNVDVSKMTLCDGPSEAQAPCRGVPEGELLFRPKQ